MLFERQLHKQLKNWGIYGDIFIFEENSDDTRLNNITLLKLRKDAKATLITLKIEHAKYDSAKNENEKI